MVGSHCPWAAIGASLTPSPKVFVSTVGALHSMSRLLDLIPVRINQALSDVARRLGDSHCSTFRLLS